MPGFRPIADGKVAVEFWLPAEKDAMSIGDKQVTLRVLARRASDPEQTPYDCRVTLALDQAAGTSPAASPAPVKIEVLGGPDGKDHEDVKKALLELAQAKLERFGLQLPLSGRLLNRQSLPVQLSLRRVELSRGYLTVAGQLK